MNVLTLILALLTLADCIVIIVLVALQNSKKGLSGVITGGNGDSYFDRNKGLTKEEKLNKGTAAACILLALLMLGLFLSQYKPSADKPDTSDTSVTESTDVSDSSADISDVSVADASGNASADTASGSVSE